MLGAATLAAAAVAFLPVTWAGVLVLGCVVSTLTLAQPLAGLLLVVLAVPFGSLFGLPLGGTNVGVTEALVWLVLTASAMRMVARRQVRLAVTELGAALGLLLLATLVSLLAAGSLVPGVKETVKWVEVLALYLLVSQELNERWLRPLVAMMLLTGGLAALHGIYQFVFRVGPEPFVLFGRYMRAYGTFAQPNPYAGYLGLGAALALGVASVRSGRDPGRTRLGWLVLAAVTGLLMLAAIAMSWSRGSWLGLAAAIIVMSGAAAFRSRKRVLAAGLLVAVIVVALLLIGSVGVPSVVTDRLADLVPFLAVSDVRGIEVTDANFSVLERMAHWQAALDMWGDHPWLGIGIGNYAAAYPRYSLPTWDEPLGHAHNYYLNIGAETGLVGFLAYVLVWSLAAEAAWRACRRYRGWHGGLALGILGVLVYLSVHNVFDNLFVHGIYLQVAILLGLVSYLRRGAAVC
jgi:O-antigen ligase